MTILDDLCSLGIGRQQRQQLLTVVASGKGVYLEHCRSHITTRHWDRRELCLYSCSRHGLSLPLIDIYGSYVLLTTPTIAIVTKKKEGDGLQHPWLVPHYNSSHSCSQRPPSPTSLVAMDSFHAATNCNVHRDLGIHTSIRQCQETIPFSIVSTRVLVSINTRSLSLSLV